MPITALLGRQVWLAGWPAVLAGAPALTGPSRRPEAGAISSRVGLLRGYGNAIAPLAAAFVTAFRLPAGVCCMAQSRVMSLVEAATDVVVGYVLAVATQLAVFPLFRIEASLGEHLAIGTVLSVSP